MHFKSSDATVTAKPDLVMGYKGKKLCIIDWKIGSSKTSDYSKQLQLYAIAALNKWPTYKISDILLVEANLLQGKLVKSFMSVNKQMEIEDFIYRSVLDILALRGDRKYNIDDLQDYEYANSPLSCEYCNFEKLCRRLS